jgi:thiamine monophosphate synthase
MSSCRLYLITPSNIPDLPAFTRAAEEALSAGDVAALQIRMKEAAEHEIEDVVRALTPICHAHDVAVILNAWRKSSAVTASISAPRMRRWTRRARSWAPTP